MHCIVEVTATLRPVPVGARGVAAQGQPGKFATTGHCVHKPGFKVII